MTKRLVDIDDDLLDAARVALGTNGIKDTVNAALNDAIRDPAARLAEVDRAFAAIASVPGSDADRDAAWR